MLHYGVAAGPTDKYERLCLPALTRHADLGSPLHVRRGQRSIFPAFNSIMSDARGSEGLVLLHDDVQLTGNIAEEIRECFSDPTVAIVGAVGGRGCGFEWWLGGTRHGRVIDADGLQDYGGGRTDVDAVDGLLLALSPWALGNLRFDDNRYHGFHGYDRDICSSARAAGMRVMTAELSIEHLSAGGDTWSVGFAQARWVWANKWGDRTARIDAARGYGRTHARRIARRVKRFGASFAE